jgi:low density lipoprotein-related protein 2
MPTDVAFDWLGRNLYWAEIDPSAGGSIAMAKADGRYKRTLVTANLENPTSVAVDPELGLVFWTDAGLKPKIEVAWMDGSKRRTIVSDRILHPTALTVDLSMDHMIFWADSKLNTIEVMDRNGQNRHVVLSNLRRPRSLDVFENNVYWTNQLDGSVMKHDKFGRGVPVVLASNLANPQAIQVVHERRYNTSVVNPCRESVNPCSHLCVVIPGGRSVCKCPEGQRFVDRDQTVCDAGKKRAWVVRDVVLNVYPSSVGEGACRAAGVQVSQRRHLHRGRMPVRTRLQRQVLSE